MDTDADRPFTLDDANALRGVVGESVRAVRRTETTPDGQIEVLGHLARDGALSIAALARLRRVRHQTVSAAVVDLEALGLVSRAPDPSDARGVLVSLTDDGARTIETLRRTRASRLLAAAEEALTPEERRVLVDATAALAKLTAALHRSADLSPPGSAGG